MRNETEISQHKPRKNHGTSKAEITGLTVFLMEIKWKYNG